MFKVLQPSACSEACSNCPNAIADCRTSDGRLACTGYGTMSACPPLIVLAVIDCARLALASANLPAFGSMSARA
jgi:hypothetical protein